jgi:hypothetical protein
LRKWGKAEEAGDCSNRKAPEPKELKHGHIRQDLQDGQNSLKKNGLVPFHHPAPTHFFICESRDELAKNRNSATHVIPANPGSCPGQAPESRYFIMFWTPAFAGVTTRETFYDSIRRNYRGNH